MATRRPPLMMLHLCDSAFPLGAFAYSDGLEAATARDGAMRPRVADPEGLGDWVDASLDETIGRLEGPAVWQAWIAVRDADWSALESLDEELTALRPSSAARRSSRAMGARLLATWSALHPDARLAELTARSRAGGVGGTESSSGVRPGGAGPALPIAFAAACVCSGTDRRASVEAFAYTRLAATISAAMRLLPIGQAGAHALLARTLDRVPAVVDDIAARDARVESFAPALDIAAMTQQYLHSRLFRS
jgi:urease accessory protein